MPVNRGGGFCNAAEIYRHRNVTIHNILTARTCNKLYSFHHLFTRVRDNALGKSSRQDAAVFGHAADLRAAHMAAAFSGHPVESEVKV